MFDRLKKLFKKEKEKQNAEENINETISCISYCVDDYGELYIDVNLKNLELHTVSNLAKLLISLSSLELSIETIETIKKGFIDQGRPDLFILLSEEVADYAIENKKEESKEDEPCIKPSDML